MINFKNITERKANELQQQTNKELLNKLLVDSSEYISSSAGDANFQKITNRILEISGAKFAVFNLFDEDGRGFTTKSFSGLSDFVQISMKYFGFNFIDKKWSYDPHWEKLIGGKTIAHFNSLFELVADVLPQQVTKMIEKAFGIDHLTIVSIKKDDIVLGNFTLVFEADKYLKNEGIIHLFANQTGQYLQRLRAENVIRKSEQSYRYLFDNNPQPMFLFDVKTWKFLKVNFAAIQLYGYTNDEFMQMTLKDVRLPEDVDSLVDTLKNANSDYNFIEAVRHIKKSKEVIYVDIHTTKIIFDGREARHVLINDITQSKIANEALHDKMNELVRFHNLTVDRELRMIELKKEINELLKKNGEEERYKIL